MEQPNPTLHIFWAASPTAATALPTSVGDTLSHRAPTNSLELSFRKTAENSRWTQRSIKHLGALSTPDKCRASFRARTLRAQLSGTWGRRLCQWHHTDCWLQGPAHTVTCRTGFLFHVLGLLHLGCYRQKFSDWLLQAFLHWFKMDVYQPSLWNKW